MDSHQAVQELARYYPGEPLDPTLADQLEEVIAALDLDGAAMFIARAHQLDHAPSPGEAAALAQALYAERIGRPNLARARQTLHSTTHPERHDACSNSRTTEHSPSMA